METDKKKIYAVLTGDLVDSSGLPKKVKPKIQQLLKDLAKEFGQVHPDSMVGKLDLFRGDGWQLCLNKPELAIDATIFMRAGVKAGSRVLGVTSDSRIGVGFGIVDKLVKVSISESTGPAFLHSGTALDNLKDSGKRIALHVGEDQFFLKNLEVTTIPLLDLAVTRWTQSESLAIYGTIRGLTQQEITEHQWATSSSHGKPPTRQTISDALNRTNWKSHVKPVLEEIGALIKGGTNGSKV